MVNSKEIELLERDFLSPELEELIKILYINEKSKSDEIVNNLLSNNYDSIIINNGYSIKKYNYVDCNEDSKNLNLDFNLSNREKEILRLLVLGLSNKEISKYLKISVSTVKNHLNSIFKKIGVAGRTQAAVVVMKNKQKNVSRETFDRIISKTNK